jgi:hypothetical protein
VRRFLAARAAGFVAGACVFYGLLVGVIALEGWLGADVMAAVVAGGFAYGVAVAVLALAADRGGDRLAVGCSCLGSSDDVDGWSLVGDGLHDDRLGLSAGRRADVPAHGPEAVQRLVNDFCGLAGGVRVDGRGLNVGPAWDRVGIAGHSDSRPGLAVLDVAQPPGSHGERRASYLDRPGACRNVQPDDLGTGHGDSHRNGYAHDGSHDYVAHRLADHLRAFAVADRDNDGSRGLNLDRLALDHAHGDRDGLSPSVADRDRPGRLDVERDRVGADRAGAALGGPAGPGAAPMTWAAP